MVTCLKYGVILTHFTQNEQNLAESGKLDICFDMDGLPLPTTPSTLKRHVLEN